MQDGHPDEACGVIGWGLPEGDRPDGFVARKTNASLRADVLPFRSRLEQLRCGARWRTRDEEPVRHLPLAHSDAEASRRDRHLVRL